MPPLEFGSPGRCALNNAVCATPVDYVMDLVARINCVTADIQQIQVYLNEFANPWFDGVTHASLATKETFNKFPSGGATVYKLLHRSINHQVAKNDVNLALSPTIPNCHDNVRNGVAYEYYKFNIK
ncbi:hypothetical protein TNCV_3201751 [Trichonephila clavipes]|nr:hypothetical protein TNCV_3201751 [Trichonephila clavipes]